MTPDDVERYAGPTFPAYVSQVGAASFLDAVGKHLEAAAGRAIHGARWAQRVAICKKIELDEAVAAWEASPDSSSRGALNAAADRVAALSSGMR